MVKSRIQVGPRIACLAAILSNFCLLSVRVQALNTLRVRPVGTVSERWRSSGSESGRFDWSKSICVEGRWLRIGCVARCTRCTFSDTPTCIRPWAEGKTAYHLLRTIPYQRPGTIPWRSMHPPTRKMVMGKWGMWSRTTHGL